MSLSMSMSMSMQQRPVMGLVQRHALVQSQTLALRLDLVGVLHGDAELHPEARCPKCDRDLSPVEIFKGFNSDPNDFTTACTRCHYRFAPKLVWASASGKTEIPFYCDIQTLNQMQGLEALPPDELRRLHPAIYHSAVAHHGILKNAFAAIDLAYAFDEVADIKQKIGPFLGRLPDTEIAKLSGLKVGTIRRMRKKERIPACTQESLIEEALEREDV